MPCSSCCYEGLTAVPDLNDFCICSAPVGATFVGTTGRIYVRHATSIPCTLNDWTELITPASNSFEISDGSNTDTVVLGETILFDSPNNSVWVTVSNNTVNFALSPSIIPVNPIPGCIASNSLQGALVELCNHITGLTVTAASVTVQDALGCYAGSNVEAVLAEICNTLLNQPAANVKIVDSGGYYIANNVEGALSEIGAKLVALPATNVNVADVGNCYTATNLEAVLAEICTKFSNISANSIVVPDPGGYFISSVLTTILQEIGAELNALPASQVTIVDAGNCYAAANVETALQEICAALNSIQASNVAITDAGNYYASASVEGALQEVGASLAALPALNVTVTDVGGYFAGTNVESVLQEIGLSLSTIPGPMAVTDTNSVDLTFALNTLSADVIISPDPGNGLSVLANGLYASGGGGAICGRVPWVIVGQANNDSCDDILETDQIWHTGNVAIGTNTIPANTKLIVSGHASINNVTATFPATPAIGVAVIGGSGGTIGANITRSAIIANNNGNITSSSPQSGAVLMGSLGGNITGASLSSIISSDTAAISAQSYASIIASEDSTIFSDSTTLTGGNVIIGARDIFMSSTSPRGNTQSGIYSSFEVEAYHLNRSAIIASRDITIGTSGGSNIFNAVVVGTDGLNYQQGSNNSFLGGKSHTLVNAIDSSFIAGSSNQLLSGSGMLFLGGSSNSASNVGASATIVSNASVINSSVNSIILGGLQNSMTDQSYSVIGGRLVTLTHSGTSFMFNTSSIALPSVTGNQFRTNFTGGYFLATNNAASTGMQLSAGGSSWTAISARETKKDFTEVDYDTILSLVENVKVYSGKYKDQPDEDTHLYLIAEEWNESIQEITTPKSVLIGEEDGTRALPAVDYMDIMSVSLATNKMLVKENKELKSTISDLLERLEAIEQRLK